MAFEIQVPTEGGNQLYSVEAGNSLIFVGANGGGKTRLAVQIENALGDRAHRISAHRSLNLNPNVNKIREEQARRALMYGHFDEASAGMRAQRRWGRKAATYLLNDFDQLLQVLFAEKTNATDATHRAARDRTIDLDNLQSTKFEQLEEIWCEILPHRELNISGDDIQVSVPGNPGTYSASEMSDGERAIFYMIGQVLVARPDTLLIIDEPELHVHRSIMSKLWDRLEACRADCGFVFITHDLEFAAARSAKKVVIKSYVPAPRWELEDVPEDTGFSEEIATLILGSRQPVLFVEGGETSLDVAIYRCCYPSWTVIPRNSCSEVIHSVVTMRANAELTRVLCSGIIDADGREVEEEAYLDQLGIATLPVSEVENLVMLPSVSRAIAEHEGLTGDDLRQALEGLMADILTRVDSSEKVEAIVIRHCKRQIDRLLKNLDMGEVASANQLAVSFTDKTAEIDIQLIAENMRERIAEDISREDINDLLKLIDDKGMLADAGRHLRSNRRGDFESWLTRVMRNPKIAQGVADAVWEVLPNIVAA
ncbi:MAG: AAA family ATPase [Pseudomonadota bacterium]